MTRANHSSAGWTLSVDLEARLLLHRANRACGCRLLGQTSIIFCTSQLSSTQVPM